MPTPEQEAKLLAVCVAKRHHLRGLIIATRGAGLRRSALQRLDWTKVDWQAHLMRIPPNNNRCKKRPKVIGMTDRLYQELWSIYQARQEKAREETREFDLKEKIFPVKDFGRAYETACRLAGLDGIWFNDFRHGFATDMMEAGIPKDMAMLAAGHSTEEAQSIYTSVDERLALMIAAKLNDLHRLRDEGGEPDSPMIQ